jgi:hypothetical protein
MQRYGRIEIRFGRLHLHGDCDRLDGLGRGIADDVAAKAAAAPSPRPTARAARRAIR